MLPGSDEFRLTRTTNERLRSHFITVKADAQHVWIVDQCNERGGMSVTNDAEAVVKHLTHHYGEDVVIYYRDTEGDWDELQHAKGEFVGFVPARDKGVVV